MRNVQIGIIGSCSDLNYSAKAEAFVKALGVAIAKRGDTLVFGAEKDIMSLPTIAAKAAKQAGGTTVGVTYEKGLDIFDPESASIVIATGLVRGGGRETSLMLSCDVVIAIAGGSGTLNELCVAYQANIPSAVVDVFGGWSAKLVGEYLDDRRRYAYSSIKTVEDALAFIDAQTVAGIK